MAGEDERTHVGASPQPRASHRVRGTSPGRVLSVVGAARCQSSLARGDPHTPAATARAAGSQQVPPGRGVVGDSPRRRIAFARGVSGGARQGTHHAVPGQVVCAALACQQPSTTTTSYRGRSARSCEWPSCTASAVGCCWRGLDAAGICSVLGVRRCRWAIGGASGRTSFSSMCKRLYI